MSHPSGKKSTDKSKDPYADLKTTPEFQAFEEATKKILKVPKVEIDRRLAGESALRKSKRPKPKSS